MTKKEAAILAQNRYMSGAYVFYNAGNMSLDSWNRFEVWPSYKIPSEIDGSVKNCYFYAQGGNLWLIENGHITNKKVESESLAD